MGLIIENNLKIGKGLFELFLQDGNHIELMLFKDNRKGVQP